MLQATRGDLGYSWRGQEPRSIEDIDFLLQRQEQLRKLLGPEMAATVAASPEDFADADAFRIYHAKARFRATLTTVAAYIGVSSIAAPMLGFSSGSALVRAHRLIAVPATIGTFCTSYFFWNRVIGWNHLQRNQYLFAKNIRMLRNLQI